MYRAFFEVDEDIFWGLLQKQELTLKYCGWKNQDLEEQKEWTCWECLTCHDRDYNAAVNICKEGLRTLGTRGIAYCPSVRLTNGKQLVG